MSKKHERENTKTALSLAPLSVDEALAALLKTPPPPVGDKSTRKENSKKGRKGSRKSR